MSDKLIVVMVGLPARGKSYTSNNLCRFLSWCHKPCKVFNSGELRRKIMDGFQDSSFFDNQNQENNMKKEEISDLCYQELLEWLRQDSSHNIAIFDSTNITSLRRKKLTEIAKNNNFGILYVELITDKLSIIDKNISLKLYSEDYKEKSKQFALNDFKKRHDNYKLIYEEIDDSENINYIKIINYTEKMTIRNVFGMNESLILSYIMNLRLNKYPVYMSRHGESENNVKGILGGDSVLSIHGNQYPEKLWNFMVKENNKSLIVFTSCLKRTKQTAAYFSEKTNVEIVETRLLNEIHAGICENMTHEEIDEKFPKLNETRHENKLTYRYPEGESYEDLIERLRVFILSFESYQKPILIVAHNAILKVLLGYFQGEKKQNIPHLSIPLHEVIKLTPNSKNYTIHKQKLL